MDTVTKPTFTSLGAFQVKKQVYRKFVQLILSCINVEIRHTHKASKPNSYYNVISLVALC